MTHDDPNSYSPTNSNTLTLQIRLVDARQEVGHDEGHRLVEELPGARLVHLCETD